MTTTREEIMSYLEERKTKQRARCDIALYEYATEIADLLPDEIGEIPFTPEGRREFEQLCLCGADNWEHYNTSGNSLAYRYQIAERVCTPSELARKKGGDLPPSREESWDDIQLRYLRRAWRKVWEAYKTLIWQAMARESFARYSKSI